MEITILSMMDKGTSAGVNLASTDLDALFEQIEAAGADIVHEPMDQVYERRDCAVRDPAGKPHPHPAAILSRGAHTR